MRKQITARAVMKKNRMLKTDLVKNDEKIDEISQEINRYEKTIRRRKQKDRNYWELSLRLNEWNISKTDTKRKLDALKQKLSLIEEVKEQVELKIRELKKKIKNIPTENRFDFTEYVEKQKEDNEIDLGWFFELAEENKNIYNQIQLNTLIEDTEKLKNDFFTNAYFSLDDEGEIDTYRFFKDSNE